LPDFDPANDFIRLDDVIFSALAPGALPSGAFGEGTEAQEPDQRVLYDVATGRIFYDADGVAGGAVHFATIVAALPLSAADFVVV
jgi:hypothetical protein